MILPFYKLQIAGNGFILVDTGSITGPDGMESDAMVPPPESSPSLPSDRYGEAAKRLCDRRYGVGATGAIFLSRDADIRVFNAQGVAVHQADDAYLCAARFAFDTGRASRRAIRFRTALGEREVEVLGAHEFRLGVGSPFAMIGGRVITAKSPGIVETIEREGVRAAYAAIHVHEDVVVAYPEGLGLLNFASFNALVQKTFPGRPALTVTARCVTRETILVRTNVKRESGACASAAAALTAAICSGTAEPEALVMFDPSGTDGQPDEAIARDRDNSRRLAVTWDADANEIFVIGTGGYLFEGKFDLSL